MPFKIKTQLLLLLFLVFFPFLGNAQNWQQHYQRAVFIDLGLGDGQNIEAQAEAEADRRGWAYEKMKGDLTLMRQLLLGDWNENFLVVPPGQQITMSAGDDIVQAMDTAGVERLGKHEWQRQGINLDFEALHTGVVGCHRKTG